MKVLQQIKRAFDWISNQGELINKLHDPYSDYIKLWLFKEENNLPAQAEEWTPAHFIGALGYNPFGRRADLNTVECILYVIKDKSGNVWSVVVDEGYASVQVYGLDIPEDADERYQHYDDEARHLGHWADYHGFEYFTKEIKIGFGCTPDSDVQTFLAQ